eukprot:gene14308-15797_t
MGLMEQIKSMHEFGLHSNVKIVSSLLLSHSDYKRADKSDFNLALNKYQMLVFRGDAMYFEEEYKRAQTYYSQALIQRKLLAKIKPKASSLQGIDTEVELRFKIYQCHMKLRDFRDAITLLEGISQKQRTPKVNMELAKLYQKQGMERICPFALEAVSNVLYLGIPVQEVIALLNLSLASTSLGSLPEWVTQFIKAHSFASLNKHTKAAQIFKNLEMQTLRDNVNIVCYQAESHWRSGDKVNAINCYRRVRELDPACLTGMDVYSHILRVNIAEDSSAINELETLAQDLAHITQIKTEPWIAMAQFCSCSNRKTRAVYFAQKAHMIDTRNVEALLLKASLLQSLTKQNEALIHYREAIRLAPTYFEAYEGLVDCYLLSGQLRDAITTARNAHKTIGTNARTLTFLRKQLELQSTAHLHQQLGDCLFEKNLKLEAQEHYNKVIELTPNAMRNSDELKNAEQVLSKESEQNEINFSPQDSSYQNDVVQEAMEVELSLDQEMNAWLE